MDRRVRRAGGSRDRPDTQGRVHRSDPSAPLARRLVPPHRQKIVDVAQIICFYLPRRGHSSGAKSSDERRLLGKCSQAKTWFVCDPQPRQGRWKVAHGEARQGETVGNQERSGHKPRKGRRKNRSQGFSGNPPTPLPGLLVSTGSLTHGSACGSTVGYCPPSASRTGCLLC